MGVDAECGCFFLVIAVSTRKIQRLARSIFFGIQHVAAKRSAQRRNQSIKKVRTIPGKIGLSFPPPGPAPAASVLMFSILPFIFTVLVAVPFCLVSMILSIFFPVMDTSLGFVRFSLGQSVVNSLAIRSRRLLRSIAAHFFVFLTQTCYPCRLTLYCSNGDFVTDNSLKIFQETLFKNAHNVVISNHVLYTDWLYIWNFLVIACEDPSSICVIMKGSLRNIPLIGRTMDFLGFLFLKRRQDLNPEEEAALKKNIPEPSANSDPKLSPNTAETLEYIQSKITSSQEKRTNIVIFPEGTLYDDSTLKYCQDQAEEKKKTHPYKHLLQPKAGGLQKIMLSKKIQGIIDVTLCYPDAKYYASQKEGREGKYWEWFGINNFLLYGTRPREVSLTVEYHDRGVLVAESYEEWTSWLNERWGAKERFLTEFFETKGNPVNYKRATEIEIKSKYAGAFAVYYLLWALLIGGTVFGFYKKKKGARGAGKVNINV